MQSGAWPIALLHKTEKKWANTHVSKHPREQHMTTISVTYQTKSTFTSQLVTKYKFLIGPYTKVHELYSFSKTKISAMAQCGGFVATLLVSEVNLSEKTIVLPAKKYHHLKENTRVWNQI